MGRPLEYNRLTMTLDLVRSEKLAGTRSLKSDGFRTVGASLGGRRVQRPSVQGFAFVSFYQRTVYSTDLFEISESPALVHVDFNYFGDCERPLSRRSVPPCSHGRTSVSADYITSTEVSQILGQSRSPRASGFA